MKNLTTGRDETTGAGSTSTRTLVTSTTTLTANDRLVYVDCSATFTLTLPPVASCPGAVIYIKGVGTGGAVTVATPGDGALATPIFTQDDLTAATDYKMLMNVAGVDWLELSEVTT